MLCKKISLLASTLAIAACGGGGGESGSPDSGGAQSGDLSSADYSSRVVGAEIRRRDSGEPLGVSGLPLEGERVILSGD